MVISAVSMQPSPSPVGSTQNFTNAGYRNLGELE